MLGLSTIYLITLIALILGKQYRYRERERGDNSIDKRVEFKYWTTLFKI